MAGLDITSANAVAVLIVDTLFPAGIDLQGFSADAAVTQDSVQLAETRIGVDGKMAAGYIPAIIPVTITLEANSPSLSNFNYIWQQSKTKKGIYECSLVVTIPSISKVYTWRTGVMHDGALLPNLNQVLSPTAWVFHFETIELAGI